MRRNKEKVEILIDGSNFYHKLKDLKIKDTLRFNYRGLCDKLAGKRKVVRYGYYIGTVRAKKGDKKAQQLRSSQQKLFNFLRSDKQCFELYYGYLMKNDGNFHEKGVDVKLAVDIVKGAYENTYDSVLVLSSDTDLIPAIDLAITKGKQVEYIGFSHKPSLGLQKHVTLTRLLTKEDVEEFT